MEIKIYCRQCLGSGYCRAMQGNSLQRKCKSLSAFLISLREEYLVFSSSRHSFLGLWTSARLLVQDERLGIEFSLLEQFKARCLIKLVCENAVTVS